MTYPASIRPAMKLHILSLVFLLLTISLKALPVDSEPEGEDFVTRDSVCVTGSSRCYQDGYQICQSGTWGPISHCSPGSLCVNTGIAYCSAHCSRSSPQYPSYCDPKRNGYWFCPDANGGLWKWVECTQPKTFCYGFGVKGAGVTCMSAPW